MTGEPGEAGRKIRDLLVSLGFNDDQIDSVVGVWQQESACVEPLDVRAVGYPQTAWRRTEKP